MGIIDVRHYGDWDELLYFRDYLILHPDVAREYGKLKLMLKEQYTHDRDGYTNAKGDFIENTRNNLDERHRRIIWRCNGKYPAKGEKGCESRHIGDGVLYQAFVGDFNIMVENKE